MHSIASIGQVARVTRTLDKAVGDGLRSTLRVAFVQYTARTQQLAPPSLAGGDRPGTDPAGPSLDQYRSALRREQVPSLVIASVEELSRKLQPDSVWVAVFDADELSQHELVRLLELQASAPEAGAAVWLVACCCQETSPAKLWRLFQAGAHLCDKNVAPDVLLRSCRQAARGARASLLRFTDQAGFSNAERRAFFAECAGLSKCEAADELGCSPRTLETYWSRIFAKLRIRSTDGVIAAALRFAMLDPGIAAA